MSELTGATTVCFVCGNDYSDEEHQNYCINSPNQMSVKETLESIDGVVNVSEHEPSCDFKIKLLTGTTVDTIDEIRDMKPASLELDSINVSQMYELSIEANYTEEL